MQPTSRRSNLNSSDPNDRETPPGVEDAGRGPLFPEKMYCPQCRQNYLVRMLRCRCNTLLTDVQLSCPRCRRRLTKMRLKDWYDHYVQGTEPQDSR